MKDVFKVAAGAFLAVLLHDGLLRQYRAARWGTDDLDPALAVLAIVAVLAFFYWLAQKGKIEDPVDDGGVVEVHDEEL